MSVYCVCVCVCYDRAWDEPTVRFWDLWQRKPTLSSSSGTAEHHYIAGLAQLLLHNNTNVDNECYREIYRIQLAYKSVNADGVDELEQLLG